MKRLIIIICVLAVLVSESVLFYYLLQQRQVIYNKNSMIDNLTVKYSTMWQQYPLIVSNIGEFVDDAIVVDTLDQEVFLSEYIQKHGGKIMVCRYAELQCQECVNHTISIVADNKNIFDLSKVLFLPNIQSKRILKLQNREYNVSDCNVRNCVDDLNIQADHISYPYYMVVDSNLRVCGIYAPNKSTHGTDFDFKNLKLMYDNLVDKQ